MKKQIDLKNLVSLNWEELLRSKSFWVGLATIAFGIYLEQYEVVLTGAGIITIRDGIAKKK